MNQRKRGQSPAAFELLAALGGRSLTLRAPISLLALGALFVGGFVGVDDSLDHFVADVAFSTWPLV